MLGVGSVFGRRRCHVSLGPKVGACSSESALLVLVPGVEPESSPYARCVERGALPLCCERNRRIAHTI